MLTTSVSSMLQWKKASYGHYVVIHYSVDRRGLSRHLFILNSTQIMPGVNGSYKQRIAIQWLSGKQRIAIQWLSGKPSAIKLSENHCDSLYMTQCDSLWLSMTQCDSEWLSVTQCDSVWLNTTQCDSMWLSMTQYNQALNSLLCLYVIVYNNDNVRCLFSASFHHSKTLSALLAIFSLLSMCNRQ